MKTTVTTTTAFVVVFAIVLLLPLATLGEEVSEDTQDEQPHMHGVTNQQWADLSSLLSTIPEKPSSYSSDKSSSGDVRDATPTWVCNYNEACPEVGSRCVRGFEMCHGKTYHTFLCNCVEKDDDSGDLIYSCEVTNACAGSSSSASGSSSSEGKSLVVSRLFIFHFSSG
mmetsp:Transcript_20093/g.42124  ORF Transcript_20093/g.42124 Transcript_20093/m.42124 type:complete len:169 (+) Transcript_20093:100-606(+)